MKRITRKEAEKRFRHNENFIIKLLNKTCPIYSYDAKTQGYSFPQTVCTVASFMNYNEYLYHNLTYYIEEE